MRFLGLKQKKNTSEVRKENLSRSPGRTRRNQSFTQKSMQVKSNQLSQSACTPQTKICSNTNFSKLTSGQETPGLQILKKQKSLKKNIRTSSIDIIYQSPENTKKKTKEIARSSARHNSLYTKSVEK